MNLTQINGLNSAYLKLLVGGFYKKGKSVFMAGKYECISDQKIITKTTKGFKLDEFFENHTTNYEQDLIKYVFY